MKGEIRQVKTQEVGKFMVLQSYFYRTKFVKQTLFRHSISFSQALFAMKYAHLKGFTLIELVVVIAIIGIISAYVTIKESSTTPFDLDVETNKVLIDLRLARTLSMSFNQNYRFVVTSSNTYQIQDASNTAYYNPAAESTTSNVSSSLTLSPTTTIAFNGLGQSMNASNVLNSSAVTLSLSDGSNARSITIEPQTGFIHE